MSIVPGRSESPHFSNTDPNNKFARIDKNPSFRNSQYFVPYAHASQSVKNSEFYKSPLTSVEINRKNKARVMPFNQGHSHIVDQPESHKKGICQDCDWKQILCWLLIALALIGLAVGLFFLIRSIMGKNTRGGYYKPPAPDTVPAPSYTGINPVYVSPIPLSNMQVPIASGYMPPASFSDSFDYITSPTSSDDGSRNQLQGQEKISSTDSSAVTQPTVYWNPDTQNIYVNPLDAYSSQN